MRWFVEILAIGLICSASAFDYEAWMAKRAVLSKEAARMQAAYTNCVAHLEESALKVTIPLEVYENGAEKTTLQAEEAQFFQASGLVWARGVVVRKFEQDGSQEAQLDVVECVVDRNTKTGWGVGPVKVVQGKTVFTGEDVFFSSPDRYVRTMRNPKVVSEDLKTGGLRP